MPWKTGRIILRLFSCFIPLYYLLFVTVSLDYFRLQKAIVYVVTNNFMKKSFYSDYLTYKANILEKKKYF